MRPGRARPARKLARIVDVGDTEMYRVAYVEGQRALDDQREELNGLRERAATFVGFVGAAIGFLVGTAAGVRADHDVLDVVVLTVASLVSLAMVSAVTVLLIPRAGWSFRLSSQILVDEWIEGDGDRPSEADFLRALAKRYDGMRVENEQRLRSLRSSYVAVVISGSVAVLSWSLLAFISA